MIIPTEIIQTIDSKTAWKYSVVPIGITQNSITLISNTQPSSSLKFELELITGKSIELKKHDHDGFDEILKRHYPKHRNTKSIDIKNKELLMVNLIEEAKSLGSSDIHIEPYEQKARIRYRINGKLIEKFQIDKKDYPSLVNKLKIYARLDIAQKRLPQDGRILFKSESIQQELRVSTLPTLYGEKIVLRLLGNSSEHLDLDKIGMSPSQLSLYKKSIHKSTGIILISGPTGSGKTTTLYTTLKELNKADNNIMTVEDPIEYTLEGVNQVQLRENINLTFAVALKSFLRQDPDIIMLGEIRDKETAQMAIRAALTGHLVLSTIHTNSAWGTINRLNDMGVPSFLIANTLNLSVAQRLVRILCSKCKIAHNNSEQKKHSKFGNYPSTYYDFSGCEDCNYTGFSGRQAIYELIENNDNSKNSIITNTDESNLSFVSPKDTLDYKAWQLFYNGLTTISEINSLIN